MMITAILCALATTCTAQQGAVGRLAQSVHVDRLVFRVEHLYGFGYGRRLYDEKGLELVPEEADTEWGFVDVLSPRETWVTVLLPRKGADGQKDLVRQVSLEVLAAIPTLFAVRNLKPGTNYLNETVRLALGDVNSDRRIDEQDLEVLRYFISKGGRNNGVYKGSYGVVSDLNRDSIIDEKDVAIVRSNLGRAAPTVGPVKASDGYRATQTRPAGAPIRTLR
ncbi:MAG: hypothetical protein AMXMBFR81_06970 [Chthonomonas sp.]